MPHQYENVIDGDLEEIVSLATDMERWKSLMPHVTNVADVQQDADTLEAVVRIRLWRPFFYNLRCRTRVAEKDGEYRSQLQFPGRLSGGLYQNWRFNRRDDDRVVVRIYPRTDSGRWSLLNLVFNRVVIDPFTVRLLDMISLLTEAERLTHLGLVDE